eukprot:Ihof_evm2s677 gene=Ihof_evmTU2s677
MEPIDLQVGKLQGKIEGGGEEGEGGAFLRTLQSFLSYKDKEGIGLDYACCQAVLQALQATDIDTRNIFGTYSSKRVEVWMKICSQFKEDNLYLAHWAQMLVHTTLSTLPSLQREITRCQRTAQDCQQKVLVHQATALQHRQQYARRCKDLGIQGLDVQEELKQVAGRLRETCDGVVNRLQAPSLLAACTHYSSFISWSCGLTSLPTSSVPPTPPLPMMSFVAQHGNDSLGAWLEAQRNVESDLPASAPVELPASAVDQWDITDSCDIDDLENMEQPIESWEIKEEQDGDEQLQACAGKGVLEDLECQRLLRNELEELQGFLTLRQQELAQSQGVISRHQFQEAPAGIEVTSATLHDMGEALQQALSCVQEGPLHLQTMMATSPRYLESVAAKLMLPLHSAKKMEDAAVELRKRQQQLSIEETRLHQNLKQAVEMTKLLQDR